MWMTVAFIVTAAVFIGLTLSTFHHQRWARRLPNLDSLPVPADTLAGGTVRCSVIIAARDEAARLEASVRHVLAQRHVALEVIVVDDRISGVNRDLPRAHLGIGAFNLMCISAYRACGGYEALRLTVVDDVKLGLLLRRAGKRTRAFLGGADVECHWGTTVPRMITIMEKNYFAAVDFRVAPVVAGATVLTLLYATSIIGLWTGSAAGLAAGVAPWSLALPAAIFARRLGWSPASAIMTPLFYPILFAALVNSTVTTLRQGGVRWRDTFYSLDTLRRGNVQ
jgi:hypothetical protein